MNKTYSRDILLKILSKEQIKLIDERYDKEQIMKIAPELKIKAVRTKLINKYLKKYGV